LGEGPAGRVHVAVGNLNLDISVMLDRFPDEDSHVFARDSWIGLGGAATNYSVAVARLGHTVYLVARAGGDALKLGLLDQLIAEGVRVDHVAVAPGEPLGTVIVMLVPSRGTRTMVTIRGANSGLRPEHVPLVSGAGVYHLASTRPIILEGLCERSWWRQGFIATYDPGGEVYRYPRRIAEALQCVDVLLLNEREASALAGAAGLGEAREILGLGPRLVVVKKGSGGAVAYTMEGEVRAVLARRPRVVDVTGAGDAFDAAFNVWLLETGSVEVALAAAVAAGAVKVGLRGSANMPGRADVEKAMEGVRVEHA